MKADDGTGVCGTCPERQLSVRTHPHGAPFHDIGKAVVAKRSPLVSQTILSHAQPRRGISLGESQLGCLTAACAQRSSLWVGCVVPPFMAWRPHPPVWRSPSHFPDRPVIDTVFDIHRVILSNLHTFRTFAAVLSRIAAFNTPGDPMRALLSSFRIGSGHRIIRTPLASPTPRESAPCGNPFSALHPFAFATALLFARPLS